jgi:outer membrane protein OmpA-like peptidoglycan-associated protein
MINDTRSAEEWLAKVVSDPEHNAEDVLHYADVLKSNGKYPEAIIQYQNYGKIKPSLSEKSLSLIRSCEKALEWINDPVYFDVVNAGSFNSEYSDFGLITYDKGFILTSDRKLKGKTYTNDEIYGWTGTPFLKLLLIRDKDNPNTAPEEIQPLNNQYHNGPGVFNANSSEIYFTRTKMVRLTKKPLNNDPTSWYDNSSAKDYTNRLEIFFSKRLNGKWQQPVAFRYNNPESYSVGHPAISPDGSLLYFVTDMPGGYGGSDIYFCEKLPDETWSEPKNAGSSINTAGKEVFPYIAPDGTLYFSSDGLSGMGGLDMFSAIGSKDKWSSPENMKYPFNSPKDDFSIIFSGDGSGYFSSNREGGKGKDDVYGFVSSPPKNLIIAVTTKERLEDNSILILKGVNVQIKNDENALNVSSDDMGIYFAEAACNDEYKIKGTKDGYFAAEKNVMTVCKTRHDTVFVELFLEKIIINKPIVLKNIYYDFDKWNIRPDASLELDKLVKVLEENPEINIELGSHTDSRGSDEYNRVLSQKRAEAAVAYIVSRGISQSRITAKGYGENIPVNQCVNGVKCSDEEFQMNRRTEFKVTSISKNQAVNLE